METTKEVEPQIMARTIGHIMLHHEILRARFEGNLLSVAEATPEEKEALTIKGVHHDGSPLCEVYVFTSCC